MTSQEGKQWTRDAGLSTGLPTVGLVSPPSHKVPSPSTLVDVIVIGAGYAGLIAARDLAIQGHSVFLIEARDRIGGRTWHTTIDGFNYEMGGTWIHWHMPHVYREVSLYGLNSDWMITPTTGGKHDYCTIGSKGRQRNVDHEEELSMFAKVWGYFCNVDGENARTVIPWPFDGMSNRAAVEKYDNYSCHDRIEEIKNQLSDEEQDMLRAILVQMGGGPLDALGFVDALRWYALGGWTPLGMNEIGLNTRLKSGQSTLARRIFDHAASTGKLSYAFSTPIQSVVERNNQTIVSSRSGQSWKARSVVCTIPLNVLADVTFSPPLSLEKVEALAIGHANRGIKIHATTVGEDLRSWTSFSTPGKGLVCGLSDGMTPAGDTHLVCFGPVQGYSNGISLAERPEEIIEAVLHLLPIKQEVKRLVYHDWAADEFAKGTWCYYKPGFASKYLEVLQQSHGNVHFASADWSDGWRGWIDGAVQQGSQVAMTVDMWLRAMKSSHL